MINQPDAAEPPSETPHHKPERGLLTTIGPRTDDGRVDPAACLVSASLPAGVFHLLTADDDVAFPEVPLSYGGFVTVCGEMMTRSDLPPSCYPPGESASRDPRYCPECVREAARWSTQAGQDDEPYGYLVGKCGHWVPLTGATRHVGPCEDCDT